MTTSATQFALSLELSPCFSLNSRIFTLLAWTQIKPLIGPTKQIMKIGVKSYDWHELFPKVQNNAGAIIAVWAPIVVVYFMDTQIWYSEQYLVDFMVFCNTLVREPVGLLTTMSCLMRTISLLMPCKFSPTISATLKYYSFSFFVLQFQHSIVNYFCCSCS
ncbi:uncharacterized protein LOC133810004 isoform X1 [Humulus lupulus]|uniref:uncharacterized protein LOC133810004 isoform X1 n=1 Tax=Humulus lupulus TaxID=3486 RepID=UPI002B41838A|nr:uncharacterized protein LOC133810004 isoform X1 [Humulus lupulus]XP_062101972.1 uncharacterized protein LOC133810004 isoform X1 [Humulus lupulus]